MNIELAAVSKEKLFMSLFRLSLALVGLIWLSVSIPLNASAMTTEEEKEMARDVMKAIKKQVKFVEDDALDTYINELGKKILKVAGPQPFDYRFYVINSEVVNAFATPAGNIFVHSGLIVAMESEEQLVAVMAHEIAHVTSRHISNRISANRGLTAAAIAGAIVGAVVGGPVGSAMLMGSVGGAVQAQLSYSREDEREADSKGLDYLVGAGYDPHGMADSFKVLQRNAIHSPKDTPSYLTTHPALAERIAMIGDTSASYTLKGKFKSRDESTFQSIRYRLMAQTGDINSARNYFESMSRKNTKDPWAHYGLAMVYQREQDMDRAFKEFNLALKLDPANTAFMTDQGALLFQKKDFQGVISTLSRAIILKPNSTRALYLLARSYEELGVPNRAMELYERVLFNDPKHLETLYQLGALYGRQGDLARAHLYSGLFFMGEDDIKKALYHLRRAKDQADSAPAEIRRRIETALEEAEKQEKPDKKKTAGGGKRRR